MGSRNTFLVLCFLINLLMTSVFAQPRMAGGQKAVVGQFKFVVALEMLTFIDNSIIVSGCTGSIISESWILTATHCLTHNIVGTEILGMKNVTRTQVLAGDVDSDKAFRSHHSSGQMRYASKYYTHPDAYDLAEAKIIASQIHENDFLNISDKLAHLFGTGFDIALLQLHTPFTFGTNIGAIALATDYNSVNNKLNCIEVGFGMKNSSHESMLDLNYIPVTIGGIDYCRSAEPHLQFAGDYLVCARGKKEFMNPCVGDSGGPVTCGEDGQEQVLYGVGSSTLTKGLKDFCGKRKIVTTIFIFPNQAVDWMEWITHLKIISVPTDPAYAAAAPASGGPFLAVEATLFALVVFKSSWDIINY